MRLGLGVACVAVGSFLLASSHRAAACSSVPCTEALVLPGADATVPQNVPGFPFRPGKPFALDGEDAGTPDLQTITLKDAAGNVVPITLKAIAPPATPSYTVDAYASLVVPASPLTKGRYSFEMANPCQPAPHELIRAFTVADPQPLPTDLGTLRLAAPPALEETVVPGGASCVRTLKAIRASVVLDASASFTAFRSIATLSVFVDGKPWRGPVKDYSRDQFGPPKTFDPFTVYADCDASTASSDPAPGKHIVEVRAHIEGAPSDPAPASVEVDLACPAATGAPPTSNGDAAEESGSCAATPPGLRGSAAGLGAAAIGIALLAVGSRRRIR